MSTRFKAAVFAAFFVSGFCSLLYQLVWLRLAFAAFGVVTPVLSLVVSVFMAGLGLGAWAGGRWMARGVPRPLLAYALAELWVALGAFLVPGLFQLGARSLLGSGELDSGAYLLRSALALGAALLPWCFAMGLTVPCMLAELRRRGEDGRGFSYLYLANVAGALSGVAVTAFILIEWLGLAATARVGATLNLALAAGAALLAWRGAAASAQTETPAAAPRSDGREARLLFATGFLSMAMEVAWTRLFAPVLRAQVYSFALVLFSYLLGTAVGSALYRRHARHGRSLGSATLLGAAFAGALLPLLAADPRLQLGVWALAASLLPFCAALGYLSPLLVDRASGGEPRRAGQLYGWNVLGSVLGPLAASYLLLAHCGVLTALLLLSAPLALLALAERSRAAARWGGGALAGAALLLCAAFTWTYEEPRHYGGPIQVRHDSTASVISLGQGKAASLLVNGLGITHATAITKVMAHLPAAFLARPPRKGLVICFGMGTTFRSLCSWGMDTTAVELVPSVRDAFAYYYPQAPALLAQPGRRIVVDDGRRYLSRVAEQYDVITLDPPPPVEAAASSLLYSEEFYALAKRRLAPGGILQQWEPDADAGTAKAMLAALRAQFPYVRLFRAYEGPGVHFLASTTPIAKLSAEQLEARLPEAAKADLFEWFSRGRPRDLFRKMLDDEADAAQVQGAWTRSITDDRPYNEYFFLRTNFPGLAERLN